MSKRGGNTENTGPTARIRSAFSPTMPSRSPLAFGPFVLDLDRAELSRDGISIKIAPQPFAVLTLLVSRPGALVTRDELRRTLWGDETFVDYNAGLNFCIAQLRTALGDPASRSELIAAVPRRGYRFVGLVREVAPPLAVEPRQSEAAPTLFTSRMTTAWAVAAAAAAIAVTLAVRTRSAPVGDPSRTLAAAQLVARAWSQLADAGPAELSGRARWFEQAIEADSGSARAYAGLAETKLILGAYRAEDPSLAFAAAKVAAERAIAADPLLAEGHAAHGAAILLLDWNWSGAGRELAQATVLDPQSTRAHTRFSEYLSATGRHDQALSHARTAAALAPGSPSALTALGLASFYAGDLEAAVSACDEAAAVMAAFVPARMCVAAAAAEAGRFAVAAAQISRLIADASAKQQAERVRLIEGPDARTFWSARLNRLTAGISDNEGDLRAVSIAAALVHLGDHDGALDWLERAANQQTDTLIYAGVHPAFKPLRSKPRFQRVLQRMGRPD
jgi:DNA-binding winged helix-turn-helix (wHTH) protein/tetratricopeptide (TPR) repeat protein